MNTPREGYATANLLRRAPAQHCFANAHQGRRLAAMKQWVWQFRYSHRHRLIWQAKGRRGTLERIPGGTSPKISALLT